MSYALTRRQDLGALQLTHCGYSDIRELTDARELAIKNLGQQHCARLLVDVSHIEKDLGLHAHFEFTPAHASLLPAGTQVALVIAPDFPQIAQLMENVANNRDVQLAIFSDLGAAESWLRHRRPQ